MKARLPQGYGKTGKNNMQDLAMKAKKMQEDMDMIESELKQKEYSVTSGGGAVEVVISGSLEVKSIKIKPEVVDKDDIEMMSDLIVAAVNEAIRKANDDKESAMGSLTEGFNIPGLF